MNQKDQKIQELEAAVALLNKQAEEKDAQVEATLFDMEWQRRLYEKKNQVLVCDHSKVSKIDVGKDGLKAIIRKCVRAKATVEEMDVILTEAYQSRPDRSRTRSKDKAENIDVYGGDRATKILRDILKEAAIVGFLGKKMGVKEYKETIG